MVSSISGDSKLWKKEKPDFANLITEGDTDSDGAINETEFETIMKEKLGEKYNAAKTKELFTQLSGGDSTISTTDLTNAPHHKPPINNADLNLLLSAADINADGVITKEELQAYLESKLGTNFNLAMFLIFFNTLSGGDDSISADDLSKLASVNAPPPADNLSSLISEGDTNGDGVLSKDELQSLMESKLGSNFNQEMFDTFFSTLSGGDDTITAADIANIQKQRMLAV
ncbi:MAG: EF-hand domain-containing protein [Candidatus Margulisiibacteriota bacterium]|jgi:Ca2+-binding EF-hand superfamily protein